MLLQVTSRYYRLLQVTLGYYILLKGTTRDYKTASYSLTIYQECFFEEYLVGTCGNFQLPSLSWLMGVVYFCHPSNRLCGTSWFVSEVITFPFALEILSNSILSIWALFWNSLSALFQFQLALLTSKVVNSNQCVGWPGLYLLHRYCRSRVKCSAYPC